MSELTVGTISGLAANSYVIDLASGSTLDLSAGAVFPAGNIIQVIRATDTTNRITTSTSYVDASLSATITPKKSTSAIILIYTAVFLKNAANDYVLAQITDSSNNSISGAEDVTLGSSTAQNFHSAQTIIGYATPGTTSATTYKVRFKSFFGNQAQLLNAQATGQLYAIEVAG
jgi:hypothetical protein